MPDQPLNLILITTDQQRGDALGLETPALQTPNLDALARGGTWFRRGYTECPSCFPARRSLMSGMAAAAQGMVGMSPSAWDPPHTLAGELVKAGYQTQLVGKLHLQPHGKRFGFEHMVHSDAPHNDDDAYVRWLRDRHGRTEANPGASHGVDANGWVGRPSHLPEDQTHTWWCVNESIDFLRYRRDPTQPFFLNLSIFDPHPPLCPPQAYYDRYIQRDLPAPVVGDWADPTEAQPRRGDPTNAWRIQLDEHQMRCARAAYYGTVNFVDDQLGRLFNYLQRNRLWNNTAILFTSDHGEMLGDHHLYRKCWPYEASARVPYILRVPGMAPRVVDSPVGLQDVLPTFVELAGGQVPTACTGHSLLPVARGESERVREVFHGEHAGQYDYADGVHYLVSDTHKYVWYSQRQTEHLFDLSADPQELHDLALSGDAEALLAPWRERLVQVLADRPEGFVADGQLVVGRPHRFLIPDLEPDRFYPYL